MTAIPALSTSATIPTIRAIPAVLALGTAAFLAGAPKTFITGYDTNQFGDVLPRLLGVYSFVGIAGLALVGAVLAIDGIRRRRVSRLAAGVAAVAAAAFPLFATDVATQGALESLGFGVVGVVLLLAAVSSGLAAIGATGTARRLLVLGTLAMAVRARIDLGGADLIASELLTIVFGVGLLALAAQAEPDRPVVSDPVA